MDMALLIGWLISAVVGFAALYLVIRLAVTHALAASKPKPVPLTRAAPAYLDGDGL